MIKTIIFDLGRVIVPIDFQRGYERMAGVCGYSAAQIPERLRTCDLVQRYESGRISSQEFAEEFGSILEMRAGYEGFRDIWSSIFLPHTLIPESLLVALRPRYRLLLLSNTNDLHFEMIRENYPLLRHLHDFVLSYEVGAMKPEPAIYEEAIRRAGCAAQECFFTDDIPAYVEGARACGIDAVQFEDADQLERELRARGVEW